MANRRGEGVGRNAYPARTSRDRCVVIVQYVHCASYLHINRGRLSAPSVTEVPALARCFQVCISMISCELTARRQPLAVLDVGTVRAQLNSEIFSTRPIDRGPTREIDISVRHNCPLKRILAGVVSMLRPFERNYWSAQELAAGKILTSKNVARQSRNLSRSDINRAIM